MKITGSITIRITQAEADTTDMLRTKGIRQGDIFRRGLEAYADDIIKQNNSVIDKINNLTE